MLQKPLINLGPTLILLLLKQKASVANRFIILLGL